MGREAPLKKDEGPSMSVACWKAGDEFLKTSARREKRSTENHNPLPVTKKDMRTSEGDWRSINRSNLIPGPSIDEDSKCTKTDDKHERIHPKIKRKAHKGGNKKHLIRNRATPRERGGLSGTKKKKGGNRH